MNYGVNIFTDYRLWKDSSLLVSAIRVDHEVEMKSVQVHSDSSAKKWEVMNIDHHMLASVFADGFVETYNGASKYLKDEWSPSHVTQTLVCRVHFKKEYVENSILVKEGVPTFAKATHVVELSTELKLIASFQRLSTKLINLDWKPKNSCHRCH